MKVEYFVWEKEGQPISWVVEEGDAQTIGDFMPEQERNTESDDAFKARSDAELELAYWSEDRSQPLPFGWRCACLDEVARINEYLSQRLRGKINYCIA